MQLGAYEIALIGVGGTIIGALVGSWIGYKLSLSLANITAKRTAAMKLRDAFKDEILALNPSQYALKEELPAFLERAFQKHRTAVFDFSYFLKPREKAAFLDAWYEYYCHEDCRNENSIPLLEQYSCRGLNTEQEHELKLRAKNRIESILNFSEKT